MKYFSYVACRFCWMLVLLASISASACKNDAKRPAESAANPVNAATPDQPKAPKPENFLYAVMVNDLLLRSGPDGNSSAIAKLQEADFVVGTGNASANEEEIELRGLTYTDHYYEVSTTTPEQHKGWAFGGGLALIYTGDHAGSPDLGKLTQLATVFKNLKPSDLNSGKKAWDYVNTHFANANGALADAAYILYDRFARRMENEGQFYRITEKMQWSEADFKAIYDNTFDLNSRPQTKQLADNVFSLETGEGMVFPIPDYHRIEAFFAPKVSPAMQAYLAQRVKEHKDPESEDGGLAIDLPTLAERAVFWEQFNQANPYFPLNDETLESQRWMLLSLTNGMDNTPISDYETKRIRDDFKNIWAETAKKYPNTEAGRKCKEIYDLCAAEGWQHTKAVEDWHIQMTEALYKQ